MIASGQCLPSCLFFCFVFWWFVLHHKQIPDCQLGVWSGVDNTGGAGILKCVMNLSVFEFDWEYGHCTIGEIDYDVVGYYIVLNIQQQAIQIDLMFCNTNYDHQEISIVNYCSPIGNYSVKIKRYQGNKAQRVS